MPPKETTSLREIVDKFVPPSERSDENPDGSVRYMRNLIRSIAAKCEDILDQKFDANESINVTAGIYRFLTNDLIEALDQMPTKFPGIKAITEADLVRITPDGISEQLATDLRKRIEALSTN